MMNEKDGFQDKIIEEYYNEDLKFQIPINDAYKTKIEDSLSKMNLLEDFDFPLEVNILEIVAKGQEIRDKRKVKFELVGFISACLLIILSLLIIAINTNPAIYLYIYGAVSLLMPFVIIPIAKASRREAQ
ncbi:hypothetical protein NBE98_08085 [Clostridium swellfunianum]|uniref:hypothetical protein n=1 Tax=Clostridium swellfunianum TaxID=1367462 RepID=UPI002030755C|nr:hypothetical protein [Clostridium swellfunianum]MCM0648332.1 hypothetical protein [Clostridium swellfunianum]